MINNVTLIVLDSVGIGELPDANKYGDEGSNTLGNIIKKTKGVKLNNLNNLGLGAIEGVEGLDSINNIIGSYGRLAESSAGKDTTTGHWEIGGIILKEPFPTFPDGFPEELILKYEMLIGTKTLGNKVASGTVIIDELGEEHMKTGYPIIYTSADSVFQIAAHEDIIPINRLYEICEIARGILKDKYAVGRVIARPFIGRPGAFSRTSNRKDFSLKPVDKTMLDFIKEAGMEVMAVGKIEDIYSGQGITRSIHTSDNMDGIDKTIEFMKEHKKGLIFTNLVDFDMKYGHRNDAEGYARALEEFDNRLPEIIENLSDDEVLMITADHGCDPTTASTDHSREYVPILIYGKMIKNGVNLGTRKTFADIGATIMNLLGLEGLNNGESFASLILKN
ncbi:phosphopentomutase [Proteiniborus ethanoligenes]|uniref:Phosphopentomutase n=1 Tax=Proteiniborus ethanoligenes TaxID=415015 RepID=A0A1H3KBZ3_9FIRM|nr:phosphopentomutase [Proteiniborus ethanoligenes]TAH63508.1 MAG: phosphopentomutase [Gottschalkiaceae bacterium]SDY49118.1 phosphopentomutase [Proteiniborus ethanoligenes]